MSKNQVSKCCPNPSKSCPNPSKHPVINISGAFEIHWGNISLNIYGACVQGFSRIYLTTRRMTLIPTKEACRWGLPVVENLPLYYDFSERMGHREDDFYRREMKQNFCGFYGAEGRHSQLNKSGFFFGGILGLPLLLISLTSFLALTSLSSPTPTSTWSWRDLQVLRGFRGIWFPTWKITSYRRS